VLPDVAPLVTYNDPRMTDARKALEALPKLG
jgi:hypothetical protein